MSNLRLIKEVTSSSVSSISITDVFSADFDIYEIVIKNFQSSANDDALMRLINSSSSIIASSSYDFARLNLKAYTTASEGRSTNATSIATGMFTVTSADGQGGQVIRVFNPFSSLSYSFLMFQGAGTRVGSGLDGYKNIAVLKSTAQCTGFSILIATGTISLDVSVYGLRVDS